MVHERKITKNKCVCSVKFKETDTQASGYGCSKDKNKIAYPFPCSVADSRGCHRYE